MKDEYKIYYPYPDSEKVILYNYNIPKIDIIKIDREILKRNIKKKIHEFGRGLLFPHYLYY